MGAKPTKTEILESIKRTYLLLESLDGELAWLRDFVKPDVKKVLNEAKAKGNHLKVTIVRGMSQEARTQVEDLAVEFHERVIQLMKPAPVLNDYGKDICSEYGTSAVCDYYDDIAYCSACNPKNTD